MIWVSSQKLTNAEKNNELLHLFMIMRVTLVT